MSFKQKEISLSGSTIEILTINPVSPNAPECYALQAIKSVIPTFQENVGINGINTDKGTYPFKDRKTITITFHDESSNPSIRFDLEEISNQPGWTLNLAGVIQAVTDICGWITTATGPTTGLATEATALNILNAIVASGQDVEVLLVRDTGDSDKVLQQITDYITSTTIYKDVNGNVVVPVGPLEYLDPSAVLNLILTQNTSINNILTSSTRVPLLQRVTGAATSSVAAGKRSVSFFNAGPTDATVATGVLKPGESVTFDAGGQEDVLGAIPYVTIATGDLVITTIA